MTYTGADAGHGAAARERHGRRLFLGGPFKSLVDARTGVMSATDRARILNLIERFEHAGYTVHNAHRREGWGADFLSPEECTRLDFTEIRGCDVFVAYPGDPASPGTHIEIGWAAAFGKPIILLLEEGASYAFLVRGLHAVADVTYVRYSRVDSAGDGGGTFEDEVVVVVNEVLERAATEPAEV
jgi:hypothetical protein